MSNDPIEMCCLNCGRAIPAYYVCPVCGVETGVGQGKASSSTSTINLRERFVEMAKIGGFTFLVSLVLTSVIGLLTTPIIESGELGSVFEKGIWIFFNAHTPELSSLTLGAVVYLLPPLTLFGSGYLSAKFGDVSSLSDHLKRGASIFLFYFVFVFFLVLVVNVVPVVFLFINVGSGFQVILVSFMALFYSLIFGGLGGCCAYLVEKWSGNKTSRAKTEKFLSGVIVVILGLLLVSSFIGSAGATEDAEPTSVLEVNGSAHASSISFGETNTGFNTRHWTFYGNGSIKNTADVTTVAKLEIKFKINGDKWGSTHTRKIVVGPGGTETFSARLGNTENLSDDELTELSNGNFVVEFWLNGKLVDEYTEESY